MIVRTKSRTIDTNEISTLTAYKNGSGRTLHIRFKSSNNNAEVVCENIEQRDKLRTVLENAMLQDRGQDFAIELEGK